MPREEVIQLIEAVDPLIRSWMERHPEVRSALPAIAEYLKSLAVAREPGHDNGSGNLASTGGLSAELCPLPSATPPSPQASPSSPVIIVPRTSSQASVPLVIGDRPVFVKVEGSTSDIGRARAAAQEIIAPPAPALGDAAPVADPALIEERARLKAAACRLYVRRQTSSGDQDIWNQTKTEMDQLLSRGKALPRCFLWAFWREREQPPAATCSLCAECYDNLALATPLAAQVVARDELKRFRPQALQLMATAQSALRTALRETWLTSPDADQDDAHTWLRLTAQRIQQLIPRHMRLDDAADPFAWESLRADITSLQSDVANALADTGKSSQRLNKIKYDVKRIERDGSDAPTEYWSTLVAALADFLPTDSRVRDIVKPLASLAAPPEIARDLAPYFADNSDDEDDTASLREYSATVQRVRAVLSGSRVVITGGEPYPHQQRNLENAFDLGEVDWISLREHASSEPILSAIRRPATRLVLVLVKLAGHGHVEATQDQCRLLGIPCVLLKAGVNPERVAADILSQASVQLGVPE